MGAMCTTEDDENILNAEEKAHEPTMVTHRECNQGAGAGAEEVTAPVEDKIFTPPVAEEEEADDENLLREKADLKRLADLLPITRSDEDSQKRKKMFEAVDMSGSGQLSLAEIERAVQVHAKRDIRILSPAITAAYKASKSIDARVHMDDSYVEFPEFRMLLVNIRRYMELYVAFAHINVGKEDDKRINYKEFENGIHDLKKWGVTVDNPKEAFAEIDVNNGGQILFSEFADWALKKGLDVDGDEEQHLYSRASLKSIDSQQSTGGGWMPYDDEDSITEGSISF